MTKMNAENTIHCLPPEMPALFHVELLAYRYNPFPAAPAFKLCSLPLHSVRFLKIPVRASFAPAKGRSSEVTGVQCHNTSSLGRVFAVWCKSTQNWVFSSLPVVKPVGMSWRNPFSVDKIIIFTVPMRTGPGPLQQTVSVAGFEKSRMQHRGQHRGQPDPCWEGQDIPGCLWGEARAGHSVSAGQGGPSQGQVPLIVGHGKKAVFC